MVADPYRWRRHLGRFVVTKHMREDWQSGVMLIQSKVLIRECIVDWTTDNLRYVAQGPMFDIVEQGCEVPFYTLVIHQHLGPTFLRPFDVTWERGTDLMAYIEHRIAAA